MDINNYVNRRVLTHEKFKFFKHLTNLIACKIICTQCKFSSEILVFEAIMKHDF